MDEKPYNYNDYDKIVLYVKDNKTKIIIDSYQKLGWQLINSVCNHRYRNIMDLTFIRPHKIVNKDILQLLQVYMEIELNKLAKVERNKYSLTLSLGISMLTFGLGFIICGIIQLFNLGVRIDKFLGFTSLVIGLLFFTLIYLIIPKFYRRDVFKYENYHKKYTENLSIIYTQIEKASEEKHGKTN